MRVYLEYFEKLINSKLSEIICDLTLALTYLKVNCR